jgi:hypothetical protein
MLYSCGGRLVYMLEAIVNGVVAGIIGVIGVLIGAHFTTKLNTQAQIQLIKKQITIGKIQSMQSGMFEIARHILSTSH